jgi:8-hydroxy-5-deazaflavin:NADPH oxidoreductase
MSGMKVGVFGTGMVGKTIAARLTGLGDEVQMGSRTAGEGKVTYREAAQFAEIIFNCTSGQGSLEALQMAGAEHLKGKTIIDISNPLVTVPGKPPSLFTGLDDSLGERLQAAFPDAKIVKTLNTVNAAVMVDPAKLANADHTMFVAGNDVDAKSSVAGILRTFGWKDVVDVGDITASRALESYLLLWVRLWGTLKTPNFSVKLVRG